MQKSKLLFFFLLLFTSYPSVCAVLITPALPLISVYFGLTSTGSQLLIAIFLVGYTFGFLPYGPLANRYGRRRTSIYAVLLPSWALS
jgi:MFS family permease